MKNTQKVSYYFKKEWFIILLTILFGIGYNVLIVFGPIYQGKMIDALDKNEGLEMVGLCVLSYIGIVALLQIFRLFKRYFVRMFANRTTKTMREITYQNVVNMTQDSSMYVGTMLSKLVGDVDATVEGMRKVLTEIFDTGVFIISYFITLCIYDVKITLLSCMFIPLAYLISGILKKKVYEINKAFRKEDSFSNTLAYDYISHISLYKIYGSNQNREDLISNELSVYKKKSISSLMLETSMQPIYHLITSFGLIFFFKYAFQKPNFTVGQISAFLSLLLVFYLKSSKAAKLMNSYQKAKISWKRIVPYLVCEPALKSENQLKNMETFSIKNLQIGNSLQSNFLSETFYPGQIIGITGKIGCGKTYLLETLFGSHPESKNVYINEISITDIARSEISSWIHFYTHSPYLMSTSIYKNITLGVEGDIQSVIQNACIDKEIEAMEDREKTKIGNKGMRLSGGQKSRVALARAFYQEPKILLLDDPFSSLDYNTEKKLFHFLRTEYKDSLIFVSSHRIHSFDSMDKIIYFDEKEVICQSPNELYENNASYHKLRSLEEEERQ